MAKTLEDGKKLDAVLSEIIAEGPRGEKRKTKAMLVRERREEIVAALSQGWTPDGIAERFTAAGFVVSGRTIRDALRLQRGGKAKRKALAAHMEKRKAGELQTATEIKPEAASSPLDDKVTSASEAPRKTSGNFIELRAEDLE